MLRPAARAGLVLEDGLAQTLVADAGAEPGMLPLVSVALTSLWRARVGNLLTYAAYVAGGGLTGSIAGTAEAAWAGLDGDERRAARALLLRLAGPGDGDAVTRRRVTRSEVEALGLPGMLGALNSLVTARLVSVADGHVEVAHEALFREWPRLRDWLSDDTAGRSVLRRLAVAAAEWDAEGRDPAGLWRGTRLESCSRGHHEPTLTRSRVTEREFLDNSAAATRTEQAEAEARAAATTVQNRRLRWLLVAVLPPSSCLPSRAAGWLCARGGRRALGGRRQCGSPRSPTRNDWPPTPSTRTGRHSAC